jgi:hypothetical protein
MSAVLLISVGVAYGRQPITAEARNLRVEQLPGGVVQITYDLVSSDPKAVFTVTLEGSQDAGQTWTTRPRSVSGDVGSGIAPGPGKRITWQSGSDVERLDLTQFRFRINAQPVSAPPAQKPPATVTPAPPPSVPSPAAADEPRSRFVVSGYVGTANVKLTAHSETFFDVNGVVFGGSGTWLSESFWGVEGDVASADADFERATTFGLNGILTTPPRAATRVRPYGAVGFGAVSKSGETVSSLTVGGGAWIWVTRQFAIRPDARFFPGSEGEFGDKISLWRVTVGASFAF